MSEHEHHATEEMVVESHFDASTTPDMAAEIDKPEEVLAEKLGISKMAAIRVLEWHAGEVASESEKARRHQIAIILSELVPSRPGNLEAIVLGLMFASGTASFAQLGSQSEAAKKMARSVKCPHCGKAHEQTVTRALISHYTLRWADKLHLTNYRFRRAEETRENCRKARIAIVAPPLSKNHKAHGK